MLNKKVFMSLIILLGLVQTGLKNWNEMKNFNLLIFLLIISTILGSGCKKNETGNNNFELLTAKTWKGVSIKTDGVEEIQDCMKDDVTTFSASGTLKLNTGPIKCYSTETNLNFTWSLSSDQNSIITDTPAGTLAIVNLTETNLVYSYKSGSKTKVVSFVAW